MAGYKRAGPHKPTGGLGYFPQSSGVPTIEQFHGMLKDAIKRYSAEPSSDGFDHQIVEGLEAALALFEGYFGYFGKKEKQ